MSSMAHAALEEAWVGSLSGTNGSEILDTLGQIAAAAASGAVGLAVVREVVRLSADRDVDAPRTGIVGPISASDLAVG